MLATGQGVLIPTSCKYLQTTWPFLNIQHKYLKANTSLKYAYFLISLYISLNHEANLFRMNLILPWVLYLMCEFIRVQLNPEQSNVSLIFDLIIRDHFVNHKWIVVWLLMRYDLGKNCWGCNYISACGDK